MTEERIYEDHLSYIKNNFEWHDALGLLALILGLLFSGQSFNRQDKDISVSAPAQTEAALSKHK